MAEALPAFEAFQHQLKTLCLKEFPCGTGKWREIDSSLERGKRKEDIKAKFSVTLRDTGPQHEQSETLEEMLQSKRSPWNQDYSWSDEARGLREVAVRSPWLIDEKFVLGHFKTLRIVDRGVTDVDDYFLKLKNLEELTLSANFLQTVMSRNLPADLKVLELYANCISHLGDLCEQPPPQLQHLGLGNNSLTMVDDYITGLYWPQLLSLDLGHNNLSDLLDIVRKLQSLPRLRNLILQGNPLALISGYRGYTIDSLRKLDYLDDIPISADEKHHYKGLARRKEYILDEAKVIFQVDFIKGVPMPEELKNPDEQPEYPIVTKKYFVQFMYLEDRSSNAEIFQLLMDDNQTASVTQPTEDCTTERDLEVLSKYSGVMDSGDKEEDTKVTIPLETESLILDNAAENTDRRDSCKSTSEQEKDDSSSPNSHVAPINSFSSLWMEEMEINWRKKVIRDDLRSLRDFLIAGMDISVMEEKILSYPADQLRDEASSSVLSSSRAKDSKNKKTDKKIKAKKPAKPDKIDEAAKKKKKKGEPDVELAHMPPEFSTLASFHIPLEDFTSGDYEFEKVFTLEELPSRPQSEMSESLKKKDKKDKKGKPSSGKKKDAKENKDGRRSAKGDKGKDSKVKRKLSDCGEDGPPPPPPPLEVHVKLRLSHWTTAADLLKEEQEKLREAELEEQAQTET